MFSEATVKVNVRATIYHEVAEGNGPVNAMNLALRKAIQHFYPQLRNVHLTDYKVRILDSTSGTAAIDARADRLRRRRALLVDRGRQHEHHRGQLDCDG